MTDQQRKLFPRLRPSPLAAFLTLTALGLLGVGSYLAGWQLWAASHLRAARQALAQEDWPRARANLRLCLQVWPDSADIHGLAARAARRSGAYEDAQWHLNQCRRLGAPAEALQLEEALLRAEQGDLADVESYLLKCLRRDSTDTPLILEALTKGYVQLYRLPEALHMVQRWLQRQPDSVQALYWRGRIAEQMYDPDHLREALADYRRVVALDPAEDDARLRLAMLLFELGLAREGLEHFQRLAEQQPGDTVAVLGMARCCLALGQLDQARGLLDDLLAARPQDGLALVERGRLALQTNEPAEAETWLRQAVKLVPHERAANYLLYQCLEHQGKKTEAQLYLARVERRAADMKRLVQLIQKMMRQGTGTQTGASRDPSLCFEAGRILLRNGHDREGLGWLTSALQQDPGHRPTHQLLADYYERTGNPTRAAEHRRLAQPGGRAVSAGPSGAAPSSE